MVTKLSSFVVEPFLSTILSVLVTVKTFKKVVEICQSVQGHEMGSYYLDFKMEVRSVIGRAPVTLSNFLKLRKFRTVTVRIDS